MKRKPLPLLENITIEAYAAEGRSLAHWEGRVVFVPFTVPGDVVDLQITRKKHSFAEARVVRMVQPSAVRTQPRCQHFGVCGGCKWQMLPYEEQLRAKQQQVVDQLTRIGHLTLPQVSPIMGSARVYEYRNKLDFACASKQWLTTEQLRAGVPFAPAVGFHITGAFDKVLPIDDCALMPPLNNEIRNYIYMYAREHGMTFFDLRQQTGLLRDIVVRCNDCGEWMVIVQFHYEQAGDDEAARALLADVADKFPQVVSLFYVDNQKCNDTFGDLDLTLYSGQDHILLHMDDLAFKVGPKSFYQTNTAQARELYGVVRRFALRGVRSEELGVRSGLPAHASNENPAPGRPLLTPHSSLLTPNFPLIYDLYTGTGTIANFVARQARHVVGIEYVPEAIADAKVNSELNNIDNTEFYAGDMKDVLSADFIAAHGRPDVVITDPPRAGMHPDVIAVLLRAAPQRIVYVSCNPATQARDLALITAAGQYEIVAVQPVDMFPHTPHVENVVLLERKTEESLALS